MFNAAAKRARDALLLPARSTRSPSGTPLPPTAYRMGGKHFRSNEAFVSSAVSEVGRLESWGLDKDSRLLDWGCGAGRLAIGIREHWGSIAHYHGIDVQLPLVQWAQRHLADGSFAFTHVDASNARYNPYGCIARAIPVSNGDYDAFYAYSVFSHMFGNDVYYYLKEMARLLSPSGFGFFTAFVEDGVEAERENPPAYGPLPWSGSLHCVRFERAYFGKLIDSAALRIEHFAHGEETDGQSLFVVRRA